ncbi:MAG: excisionase [Monoglobaceae bacterium]|nr:excisionase [Acutalibacteraceae bacterium]HCB94756.1 DNA-binding protein [Ruminococcus sp.]
MEDNINVPISQKLNLTIKEASIYSNIGINKIDSMLRAPNCSFVLYVGNKKLVKRKEFEEFIARTLSI